MSDLFDAAGMTPGPKAPAETPAPPGPLADRLRPGQLEEVVGQDHLLGPDAALSRMVRAGRLSSLVLWGPPGTGKTTIARLLAAAAGYDFEQISAIFSGVADLKKLFEGARQRRRMGRRTLLFVDEIHRFNRAQQDGFLPYVEDGTVVLVGATTENPSFELNAALLSRAQVLVLHRLDAAALEILLQRAESAESRALPLTPEARQTLVAMADGDGRYLLNVAEDLLGLGPAAPLDPAALADLVHRRAPVYDKAQEGHYNLISALHKSLRGSDPDAALYWMARMLVGGEDPLFILRRLIVFAAEDVGMADPRALLVAMAAREAFALLGSPEGEIPLAQCVVYLATAPKSNASYRGLRLSKRAARDSGSLMPPKHILNAPTRMMKDLGYGKDYAYDHDQEDGFSGQNYFPDGMARQTFYNPTGRGYEAEVEARLAQWNRLRTERQS